MTYPDAPLRPTAAPLAPNVGATTLVPQHLAVAHDRVLDALASELRMIVELIVLMRRQRAAVSTDNLQEVEESV